MVDTESVVNDRRSSCVASLLILEIDGTEKGKTAMSEIAIKARVLQVKKEDFNGTAIFKVLVGLDNGECGFIYSRDELKTGNEVTLTIGTKKDLSFTLRPLKTA